jgi:hypothetical protein
LFENDGGIRSKFLESVAIATAVSQNVLDWRAARGMPVSAGEAVRARRGSTASSGRSGDPKAGGMGIEIWGGAAAAGGRSCSDVFFGWPRGKGW